MRREVGGAAWITRRVVVRAAMAAIGAIVVAALWLRLGPIPADLLADAAAPSTLVVDRHGEVLYEALSTSGTRLERIDAAAIPPVLAGATLAAEDRRFYSHPGVDLMSLLRAARHDLAEGRIVEGGSTITQQVAKLLIQRRDGPRDRTVRAKLREMVLAVRLEHRFTKAEILALYLNLASYGNQISGAARASRSYFGVPPGMLTPAQAAFLAALPQRPSTFNPWRAGDGAKTRQQAVLRRMADARTITAEQLREALAERLAVAPRQSPFLAPHFVNMALASAPAGARRVETTLDMALQRDVEGIIESNRATLRAHGAANVAVVVLDNRTSEWLAWEGSGAYFEPDRGGAINGPVVPRQPGSALKPFTYALAFERGRTPATVLADVPSHFPTGQDGVVYSPRNYDGRYRGPLRARNALAGSENVPAVALAFDLGVPSLQRLLARAGLTTLDRPSAYYGLGLTLGNAEVRLDELVAAYASFAREGRWVRPTFLRGTGHDDERQLFSPLTAFWISDILSDAEARAFIFGRGGSLEFPFPVAVKTGTSQAYHDNWTIGYTRDVTVGVWVGNFDRAPLRDSSGVTGAGPIFHAVMLAAVQRAGSPDVFESDGIAPRPETLVRATICALSGMRATPACPAREQEWLPASEDPVPCAWHHASDEGLLTIYPSEYQAWVGATGDSRGHTTEPVRTARVASSAPAPFRIVSPPSGATYSVDPTLRREFQAVPLRVAAAALPVTWLVDGHPLAPAVSAPAAWPLMVGAHTIEARDALGRIARTAIVVR